MSYKSALLFVTLIVGSLAGIIFNVLRRIYIPSGKCLYRRTLQKPREWICGALPTQDDMSIFFDHTDSSSRIVGGSVAGDVPHMVAMTNGLLIRSFMCGGSLITDRHVLTAAHCIDAVFSWGSLSNSLRVTVGTNRWNSGGIHYNLARNVTHPNYVSSTIKNDIGVLVTSTAVALSNAVRPVSLNYDWVGAGVATIVHGWGRIVAGGSLSAVLLELEATSVDGEQCVQEVAQRASELNIRAPPVEPHIELCNFRALNFGACNGDSGSALLQADLGEQIGIVSWGIPCARGAPDMFVRISAYEDWIKQSIQ